MACKSILQAVAAEVSDEIEDTEKLTEKLDGLLSSNENFNSLSVVDREGVVLATSPEFGYSRTKARNRGAERSAI